MSKTILVVEDDDDIRASVIELLEDEGYEVLEADNGQAALDKLYAASPAPNLVLLDLMMPVMDGFQFCAAKESDPRISAVPVVIMSADGHVKEKQQKTGASAYLKKPVEIEVMLAAIEKYCSP